MHYRIFCLVILFVIFGYKKDRVPENIQEKTLPNHVEFIEEYVKKPKSNDWMCLGDIDRAKNDLIKFKKVYVTTSCFGCDFAIYNDEIKEFADQQQIKVLNNDISCVVINGQTAGCYTAYINNEMFKKYGKNFRKVIENGADKMLIEKIKKGKVVSVYDLNDNDKPHLPNETKELKEGYTPTLFSKLPIKISDSTSLFMDITFIVEKDGSLSNLRNDNWVNEVKENEKFKNELEKEAIQMILKNYGKWKPGKYKNNIARVQNNFRVTFK